MLIRRTVCLIVFACIAALEFRFEDPEPGFDRSAVKGVVAQLLRVKDPATATALEAVAGGKLHQVVVDNERTAKALLSRGQLANRVTLIPLNKVRQQSQYTHRMHDTGRVSLNS